MKRQSAGTVRRRDRYDIPDLTITYSTGSESVHVCSTMFGYKFHSTMLFQLSVESPLPPNVLSVRLLLVQVKKLPC